METSKDIIAAQATPPGEGALCVIRVSGRGCLEMVSGIFKPHGKSARFEEAEPFMLTLGMIADPVTGEALDEVTLVKMPAPKSYTGEDMVEITSHGGRAVPAAILEFWCVGAPVLPNRVNLPGERFSMGRWTFPVRKRCATW